MILKLENIKKSKKPITKNYPKITCIGVSTL